MRYHFVYKITNNVNSKIYVGVHSTNNINDGYMGSGKIFRNAFQKYGRESFSREILGFFYTRQAAYSEEERIVDSDFIKREDTYNIVIGGGLLGSGPDHPNYGKPGLRGESHPFYGLRGKDHPSYGKRYKKNPDMVQRGKDHCWYGKKHTPETRERMSKSHKAREQVLTEEHKAYLSRINSGENNPMWGTTRSEESKLKAVYTYASMNPLLNGDICNLILQKRKNGVSFYRIAKDLNEMGVEKMKGGSICRGTARLAYNQILKLQSIGYYEQCSDVIGV